MLVGIVSLIGDCCASNGWTCSCFPCTCAKCACVYCVSSVAALAALVGMVRVAIRKDDVEIVGGDEKTRREIERLLKSAHYEVKSVAAEEWHFGTARVDVSRQLAVSPEGVVSRLTGRELKILRLFSVDPQAVVSREAILAEVWGLKYWGTTRTVDQHIAQLRKKLGIEFASVRGVGYRIDRHS